MQPARWCGTCAMAPGLACSMAREASSQNTMRWSCRGRGRASRQARREALSQETIVQAVADRNKGAVPEFVDQTSGKGVVESFTVLFGRNGAVEHGVVMLRTNASTRTLARVPVQDAATLAHLTNMDRTPV